MKPEMERVLRPRDQARQSYNSMSRWYDLFTGSEKQFTDIGIQMLDVQSDEFVLEISCGTGHALVEFAGKGGKVIAIDISEGMIKVARENIRGNSVGLCQADGLSLPFSDEQFDAAFLSFTLELFDTPDMPRVLTECHRILKVDGRIGVVSLAKQDTSTVRVYEWFHRRMPKVVDCRPIYVQSVLREAKFDTQRSTTKTMWGLPVEIVAATKQEIASSPWSRYERDDRSLDPSTSSGHRSTSGSSQ